MESVGYSMASFSLRRFATAERIFSKELPQLMTQAEFLTELTCNVFFHLVFFLLF